jgi:hypothetical protein
VAIAIDASSPAVVYGNTSTYTTNAFIPPNDALLLLMLAGNSDSGENPPAPTVFSSPSLVWTQDAWDHRNSGSLVLDGQAAIHHAKFTTSPSSMTVSETNNAGDWDEAALALLVLTGHDPTAPIGVVGGGRQNGGSSLSVSFDASITGGQGFLVVCDWFPTDSTTWAADTGCSIIHKGYMPPRISWAVVQRTDPDEVVGVTTTLGLTGLVTDGIYHWAYAEAISAEAVAASQEPEWTFGQVVQVG